MTRKSARLMCESSWNRAEERSFSDQPSAPSGKSTTGRRQPQVSGMTTSGWVFRRTGRRSETSARKRSTRTRQPGSPRAVPSEVNRRAPPSPTASRSRRMRAPAGQRTATPRSSAAARDRPVRAGAAPERPSLPSPRAATVKKGAGSTALVAPGPSAGMNATAIGPVAAVPASFSGVAASALRTQTYDGAEVTGRPAPRAGCDAAAGLAGRSVVRQPKGTSVRSGRSNSPARADERTKCRIAAGRRLAASAASRARARTAVVLRK